MLVLFVLCVSVVGFLTFNEVGFTVGIVFSLSLILFLCVYGDTVVLTILRARKLKKDDHWKRVIDSISFKIGHNKIAIFSSTTSEQPLYLLESVVSGSSIIINPILLKKFDENELRAILEQALMELKHGRLWLIVVISLLFNILEYPIFIMLTSRYLKYVSFIFYYILTPLMLVKVFSIHSRYDATLDRVIKDDNKYLLSGLFKLPTDVSAKSRVCNDLSFFRNDLNSLSSTILYDYNYLRQLSLKEKFGGR